MPPTGPRPPQGPPDQPEYLQPPERREDATPAEQFEQLTAQIANLREKIKRKALGDHIYDHFIALAQADWQQPDVASQIEADIRADQQLRGQLPLEADAAEDPLIDKYNDLDEKLVEFEHAVCPDFNPMGSPGTVMSLELSSRPGEPHHVRNSFFTIQAGQIIQTVHDIDLDKGLNPDLRAEYHLDRQDQLEREKKLGINAVPPLLETQLRLLLGLTNLSAALSILAALDGDQIESRLSQFDSPDTAAE